MNDADLIVIGGGISGLSVAWRARREGLTVELWEADDRLGGKISTTSEDGYVTEAAACMTAHAGPAFEQFLAESPAGENMVHADSAKTRYILKGDQLIGQGTGVTGFVTSSVLGMSGKLRVAMEPFVRRRTSEHESVAEFVTRRLGASVLDHVVGPMVSGSLASDPQLADVDAVLPALGAWEKEYGSLALGFLAQKLKQKAPLPGAFSFNGGMSGLVQLMAAEIGGSVRAGCRADALERTSSGWCVSGNENGREISLAAPDIVLAVPADVARALVRATDPDLADLLAGIDYAPLSVVHTGFDAGAVGHPLDGTGFLVPGSGSEAMTGCLWMSSLFSNHAPAGKVLLTSYVGGALHPEATRLDDREIVGVILGSLRNKLGITDSPEMVRIDRHIKALPLYHGAYTRRLAAIDARLARLSGLQLEANYRGGVSVRERITRGRLVVMKVLGRRDSAQNSEAYQGRGEPALTEQIAADVAG